MNDPVVQREMDKFLAGRPSQIGMIVHEQPEKRELTSLDFEKIKKAKEKRERKAMKKAKSENRTSCGP